MTTPDLTGSPRHHVAGSSASDGRDINTECAAFLFLEAELLDTRNFSEWLRLLHSELAYEIPIRVTVGMEQLDREFSPNAVHMKESFMSMEMRVNRLLTEHAYAENPPSRTTRLVTNVRVEPDGPDARVKSNLMLYRSQGAGTDNAFDLIVGERHDVLRHGQDGWRLLSRRVLLAHSTIPTANLGVFL